MSRTTGSRSRRIATVALTVAACIGMLGTSLGLWVNHTVFDSQRFSRTTAAALTDPVVASALSDYLTEQVLEIASSRIDLERRTPAAFRPLLPSLRSGLDDTITERVTTVLSSHQAEEILRVALEHAHRTLMRVLDGNGDVVRLNLLPLISASLLAVQERGIIPASIQIPEFTQAGDPRDQIAELERIAGHPLAPTFGQITIYRGDAASKAGPTVEVARSAVLIFRRALLGIAVVTALLVIGSIASSGRRRRTIIHLALGLAASTLVAGLFLDHVRNQLPLLVDPERREAARRLASYFVSNLVNLTHVLAVVGIAVGVLFLVTDPSWRGRSRIEGRALEPLVIRHRRAIVTTTILIALCLVALAGGSWASMSIAAVLIIGALVITMRRRREATAPATAGSPEVGD